MITAIFGPITEIIIAAEYLDGSYYSWYVSDHLKMNIENYENIARLAISSCAFTMRK